MPETPPQTSSRRGRVRAALMHQPSDGIPTQINFTGRMRDKLARLLQTGPHDLPRALNNHLLRVEVTRPRRPSADGRLEYDWWGAGYDAGEEGYFVRHSPLADDADPSAYVWPDPEEPGLLDAMRAAIEHNAGERFVIPNFGFALFERAWTLRGFESFLVDLRVDTAGAASLLDRIADVQARLVERVVALGVDGGYLGDDYGMQSGLMMSPEMWRTMIKPRLARLVAPFRNAGLPVILHSDGDIASILRDLIEIGISAINPVQPEIFDFIALKREYGRDLAFYGGVSTQRVLPYGTPAEVRDAVRHCTQALAVDGTGLLLGPSHRMMSDIPDANVMAMLEAFHDMEK